MPGAHVCRREDCPCVQCSVCEKRYMGRHKLAHHQRHTGCWLKLTSEQSALDQAGRKAKVVKSEEVVKMVKEPCEQEEQLGLEEDTVGEQSELPEEGGEQEMAELEVVMGRQSDDEERVVVEVEEQVEEKRLGEDEGHWGHQEVIVVTLANPAVVEKQLEAEELVLLGELGDEEFEREQEVLGEVEVVVGEQETPATGKPHSKSNE